jgi:hypothetical protein
LGKAVLGTCALILLKFFRHDKLQKLARLLVGNGEINVTELPLYLAFPVTERVVSAPMTAGARPCSFRETRMFSLPCFEPVLDMARECVAPLTRR